MKNHTQCYLKKGTRRAVVWIPEKFAVVGKIVKLIEEDGWEVFEVYNTRSSKEVNERSQDYKKTRKASDI